MPSRKGRNIRGQFSLMPLNDVGGCAVRQVKLLQNGAPARWLLVKDVGHWEHQHAAATQLQVAQVQACEALFETGYGRIEA